MAATEGYTLVLSDDERGRYRMMAAMAREQEAELWTRAGIVAGARVADVGCGPGAVLTQIGHLVGPGGRAAGVEPGAEARAAARQELDGAGLGFVEVREGRGDATGLEAGAWDCVMVRHVLVHTGAAATGIVAHLATLLAPGGHLYLVDVDLDGARTAPVDDEMDDQMRRYAAFHRRRGNDVRIGPQLGFMLRTAGLEVVENRGSYVRLPGPAVAEGGPLRAAREAMVASGDLQPGDEERWAAARLRFAERPGAEVWLPSFIAIGRQPDPAVAEG